MGVLSSIKISFPQSSSAVTITVAKNRKNWNIREFAFLCGLDLVERFGLAWKIWFDLSNGWFYTWRFGLVVLQSRAPIGQGPNFSILCWFWDWGCLDFEPLRLFGLNKSPASLKMIGKPRNPLYHHTYYKQLFLTQLEYRKTLQERDY